jgi:hypothetical protein
VAVSFTFCFVASVKNGVMRGFVCYEMIENFTIIANSNTINANKKRNVLFACTKVFCFLFSLLWW